MTHARTLTRYACLAGLIAGLLVAVPSLASTPSGGSTSVTSITNVSRDSGQQGDYLQARYRARYIPPGQAGIYTTRTAVVPVATVRRGLLSALGRGIMHPGLQVAVAAAGWAWSQQDGIHTVSDFSPVPDGSVIAYGADVPLDNELAGHYYTSPYSSSKFQTPGAAMSSVPVTGRVAIYHFPDTHTYHVRWRCDTNGFNCNAGPAVISPEPGEYDFAHPGHSVSPVSEADYDQLDQHIPDHAVWDIYNDYVYPEPWHSQLDVSTLPLSQLTGIQTNGQTPPEILEDAAKWAANLEADLQGEERPYPSVGVGGHTAEDEQVDRWDEPIPPFPDEPQPEWNVEVIDELPDYDANLSGGQCPSPTVVNIPLMGSVSIVWEPICDFASMISGAVKALGLITGLFIVLGRK